MEKKLKQIIQNSDNGLLKQFLEEQYPVDVALILEELDDEEVLKDFIALANNQQLSEILREAGPKLQRKMMQIITFHRAIDLFYFMPNDDVVDILETLHVDVRKQYLNLMRNSEREEVQKILAYDAHTAGGLMTTEFITFKAQLTVGQTLEELRKISPNTEVIDILFITNQENTVIGWINIRDLFIHEAEMELNELMNSHLITVTTEVDQEEVARLTAKYDLSVVPVVNHRKVILGIITIDDIIDVLQEEYQEDMLRMGGVQESEEIGDPFLDSLKKRLPWLLIN
nr:CBS domain-containing protein [Streptococcus ovis]